MVEPTSAGLIAAGVGTYAAGHEALAAMDLPSAGHRIRVYRNRTHPESYLWIDVDARTFFLGMLEPKMTRRDVRAMPERWLRERPKHWKESR